MGNGEHVYFVPRCIQLAHHPPIADTEALARLPN